MKSQQLSWITNFIWGIADDVLRDVYVRGKYRDVILPMTVIRRLDAVLEPSKQEVQQMKKRLDDAGVVNQDGALRRAAGQAFYNTSPFRLRDLQSRTNAQQLKADFVAYLDGFSPNVQEILEKFRFRNQIPTLVEADALGFLIEKFLDRDINLSPEPVYNAMGACGYLGSITTRWALSSRNSSGASTRKTTRRLGSTSHLAMWSRSWQTSSSGPLRINWSQAPTCFTTEHAVRAVC